MLGNKSNERRVDFVKDFWNSMPKITAKKTFKNCRFKKIECVNVEDEERH